MIFVHEFLFWSHLALIGFIIISGLILPFSIVILVLILHRIHIFFFGNCLFSRLQSYLGAISKQEDFIQVAIKKLFGKDINRQQSNSLDYTFVSLAFLIAALNHLN